MVVAVEVDPRALARTNHGGARIQPAIPLSPDALAVLDDIGRQIQAAITDRHGIQVHAVAILLPGGIPKTSSGKVRRHDAAEAFARDELHEIVRLSDDGCAGAEAVASLPRTGT